VASEKRQMRWEPYVLWRDAEFAARWKVHFEARPRNVLIIAGLGFDPRAVAVSEELIKAGGEGKRDLWLLCYDNGQETTEAQRATVTKNDNDFQTLFGSPRSILRLPIAMRTDRARSSTCQNTKAAISRPHELVGYDDVIVDISALPRMISLMTVAQLLTLFDDRRAKNETIPNLHVVAAESAAQDFGTVENSLDADVILLTGFSGRIDSEALQNPKIWLPILGEAQDIRLQRIFDKVQPDQICPVVPFPTRDPRRGDRIVESHQRILFDEFRVEPRNILYASEYNPFEAYREVFMAIDRYRDALVELGDCRVFVSPLSSKLLSISALLACYDHKRQRSGKFDVGIPYVEVANYGASDGSVQAERVLTSMWLTGEWEAS
jgi:hypothetical protein